MDDVNIITSSDEFEKIYYKLEESSFYESSIIHLIGFDCEMITKNNHNEIFDNYLCEHPKIEPYNNIIICKIIIYTEKLCIIIDLTKMYDLPLLLIDILKNDSWIKTGVGISNDFIILSHNYELGILVGEIEIKNIGFLCNISNPNLLELYRLLTNDNLMLKIKNKSNWSQELSLSQIKYAINDGYMSYMIGKKIFSILCPILKNIFRLNNNLYEKSNLIHNNIISLSTNNLFNDNLSIETNDDNYYINKLQEHAQKNNLLLPKYNEFLVNNINEQYHCICSHEGNITYGIGKTKKIAKKESAESMYYIIIGILML